MYMNRKLMTTIKSGVDLGSGGIAGQLVGIREVADEIWLVSFMEYDLAFFDQDEGHVQPAPNPFLPKVLPMPSV